jgi:hypothetical protein
LEPSVPFAQAKIDQEGKVTDQQIREKIKELLKVLAAWTMRGMGSGLE